MKDSQSIKVGNLETRKIFDGTSSLDILKDKKKSVLIALPSKPTMEKKSMSLKLSTLTKTLSSTSAGSHG